MADLSAVTGQVVLKPRKSGPFFARHPWAGENFLRHARTVHRALKRGARRAVSLAFAREAESLAA